MKTRGKIKQSLIAAVVVGWQLHCHPSGTNTNQSLQLTAFSTPVSNLFFLETNAVPTNEHEIISLIDDYLEKSKRLKLTNQSSQISTNKTNYTFYFNEEFLTTPNIVKSNRIEDEETPIDSLKWQVQFETARKYRQQGEYKKCATLLVNILESDAPDDVKKNSLLELALLAQQENHLLKCYQIYAQFLSVYPDDPRTPEVLLRQGIICRQLGASMLALSKFYAVLSRALSLKLEQFAYYQRIVLQAQTEIADTYFILGRFEEAADFFQRLLKLDNPDLNRELIQFKLIQSLSYIGAHEKLIAQAKDFLTRYPNSSDQAEVRFRLSQSLKNLGRINEAMKEVLDFLELCKKAPSSEYHKWFYWQQRVGNEIANQLYKEGDFINALEIYQSLASVDASPSWQLPVLYQIGLVFERLKYPIKAIEQYDLIISKGNELGTNKPPSLNTVVEMAKWRKEFLKWQTNAENTILTLQISTLSQTNTTVQSTP